MKTPLREIARSVRQVFFVPVNFAEASAALRHRVASLPNQRKQIGLTLLDSLNGVVRLLSMPFTMVHAQVHGLHWQRILMAERIRALALDESEERERAADAAAKRKFKVFIDEQGDTTVATDVLERLDALSSEEDSLAAARELTRQGVVLVWSAFEVFARDLFVNLVDEHPDLAEALRASAIGRRRFAVDKIDWETLREFDFDLSGSLGTLLAGRTDLDDIQAMRDAFGALFPNGAECSRRLADARLWQLFQTRNLIVHRRGVVDRRFVEKTGSTLPLGAQLWVTPGEVEDFLLGVVSASEEIVSEVANVR